MQLGVFALSAVVSLTASVILVSRLERVGERVGASEALLGLLAALAGDAPEITSSITAMAGGHGTIGVGVTLGSNVFNLAALLGLSAVLAGRIRLHRRSIVLEGGLAILIALLGFSVVSGLFGPWMCLLAALLLFVPYVAYTARRPNARHEVSMPRRWRVWLERALADEELELAIAIRPRQGNWRDAGVAVVAVAVVVAASVVMEETAIALGSQAGIPPIIIGGVVLAAVTSLPNAVAAIYLASKGRGAATMSTAFNSNAINAIVGLMIPAAILGLGPPTRDAAFVAIFYVGLTVLAVTLASYAKGLDRRAGTIIIVAYFVFVAVLLSR